MDEKGSQLFHHCGGVLNSISAQALRPLRLCGLPYLPVHSPPSRRGRGVYAENTSQTKTPPIIAHFVLLCPESRQQWRAQSGQSGHERRGSARK